MTALALLLIGFSLFSAITLALTHFTTGNYQDQMLSRSMGLLLLLALGGLQIAHFAWLYFNQEWVVSMPYRIILFTVAPTFFLFCLPLIRPQALPTNSLVLLLHAVPAVISPSLPADLALPLAFIVGSGYLLWLAHSLYALRSVRENYRLEIILLGGVFAIAIAVSVLGLAPSALPGKLFFSLYAIAIGLAFFLVQTTLGLRPQLSIEVRETAQATYAISTLNNVDCDAILARLDTLMQSERAYKDPGLNLPNLSKQLGLSTHQLSELMNTHLGKGFSRYLREHRISAAKAMLCDEPSASVLSVGLSVGFSSQSNFYEAFREIEGITPGQYRKVHSRATGAK